MASDVTSLSDLAQALLTVAEDAIATTTAGGIERSYISPAAPAFDCCPFLSVYVSALSEESTSPLSPAAAPARRASYGRVNLATLVITAVRCAPTLPSDGLPTIADIEAVAVQVQEDGWALWNGVYCAIQNEQFEDLCSFIHFDSGRAIPEQGGCVGWEMILRAQIEGIPCGPSS